MTIESSAPRRKLSAILMIDISGHWRTGTPWWLVVGGIVVTAVGLTRLRPQREP